ncbi:unnamed protein product, partial [Urochloa humidicola]
ENNGYRCLLEQACALIKHHLLADGAGIGHGADLPSN